MGHCFPKFEYFQHYFPDDGQFLWKTGGYSNYLSLRLISALLDLLCIPFMYTLPVLFLDEKNKKSRLLIFFRNSTEVFLPRIQSRPIRQNEWVLSCLLSFSHGANTSLNSRKNLIGRQTMYRYLLHN
jgi:phosphate/sulfate permease